MSKLSSNKAVGCDGLSDNMLKSYKNDEAVLQKLSLTFSSWYNRGTIPAYMKKSLVTPL